MSRPWLVFTRFLLLTAILGLAVCTDGDAAEPPVAGLPLALGSELPLPPGEDEDLGDGISLRRATGTEAQLAGSTKLPLGVRAALVPVQIIKLESGQLDVRFANNRATRGVFVQGPGGISAIALKGQLRVQVSPERLLVLGTGERSLAGKEGRYKRLPPDVVRVFSRGSGVVEDSPRPRAPQLSFPKDFLLSQGGETTLPVKLQLSPGTDVVLLELSNLSTQETEVRRLQASFTELKLSSPGLYRVQARSLDRFETPSAASPAAQVRVLGPKHFAQFEEGALLLEPGAKVEMLGVEGLLMSYGDEKEYVRAVPTLSLSSSRPSRVEYREPSQGGRSLLIPLLPRILHSSLELTPARAMWPRDPVQIRLRLEAEAGGDTPELDHFKVRTSVNLREVPLEFRREGSSLLAVMPPQSGPGPWVIRVRVFNQNEHEIGRDFLEVIEVPAQAKLATKD